MKRFLVLIMVSLTLLCGCTAKYEPKDKFALPIKINAKLDGSDTLFTADIRSDGSDFCFDEGKLKGLTLHFRENGNTIESGDFTRDVKAGIFPAQEAFARAVQLLATCENNGVQQENGMKYTIDETEIMVYYDKDTGLITGIGTEESGRRFDFVIITLEPYEAQSNGAG